MQAVTVIVIPLSYRDLEQMFRERGFAFSRSEDPIEPRYWRPLPSRRSACLQNSVANSRIARANTGNERSTISSFAVRLIRKRPGNSATLPGGLNAVSPKTRRGLVIRDRRAWNEIEGPFRYRQVVSCSPQTLDHAIAAAPALTSMLSASRSGGARYQVRPAKAQPCETCAMSTARAALCDRPRACPRRVPASQALTGCEKGLAERIGDQRVGIALGRTDMRVAIKYQPGIGLVGKQIDDLAEPFRGGVSFSASSWSGKMRPVGLCGVLTTTTRVSGVIAASILRDQGRGVSGTEVDGDGYSRRAANLGTIGEPAGPPFIGIVSDLEHGEERRRYRAKPSGGDRNIIRLVIPASRTAEERATASRAEVSYFL